MLLQSWKSNNYMESNREKFNINEHLIVDKNLFSILGSPMHFFNCNCKNVLCNVKPFKIDYTCTNFNWLFYIIITVLIEFFKNSKNQKQLCIRFGLKIY